MRRYETIGCFKDNSSSPVIETLEGQDFILDGNYTTRQDSINKCFLAAEKRGFHIFALQDGGRCAASASAVKTFDKYGQSVNCRGDGKGGPEASQVYYIKGNSSLISLYLHNST